MTKKWNIIEKNKTDFNVIKIKEIPAAMASEQNVCLSCDFLTSTKNCPMSKVLKQKTGRGCQDRNCFLKLNMENEMTKKEKEFVENMVNRRGIPFAKIGMMVEVSGEIGTIKGMNSSCNLDVVFANILKMGKHKHNCHPTWNIKYFDEKGDVIMDYTQD